MEDLITSVNTELDRSISATLEMNEAVNQRLDYVNNQMNAIRNATYGLVEAHAEDRRDADGPCMKFADGESLRPDQANYSYPMDDGMVACTPSVRGPLTILR